MDITPELLIKAYASGVFPMAEGRASDTLYWLNPEKRGVIPLNGFYISKRLKRTVRQDRFRVTLDMSFLDVMTACAAPADNRGDTWINDEIFGLFGDLHKMGVAHSIECWRDETLVGGLYGVVLGGAFFGESMFHRERDASKVALVHLVGRMKAGGFSLLDAQFNTDHLARFGAREIPRETYLQRLGDALNRACDLYSLGNNVSGSDVLHAITHTT